MPTIILSAHPARRYERESLTGTQIEYGQKVVPSVCIEARTVPEIAEQARAFGASVFTAAPRVSFLLSVQVARGERKPRGFDVADRAGHFHDADWIHTEVESPVGHVDGPGVRMWGSRFAPFQMDGQEPFWPGAEPDDFTSPADGSVGLYGYLRAINARVQRCTDSWQSLPSLAHEVPLHDRYGARVHPFDVAAELLARRLSPTVIAA
ncbi:hypothetical protein HLH44_21125 [Gluconacetobacter sp. 1c LMG 22058]|uniref:Uncharacterized protein n=1 Tax=Gluconacetobacter dulcium TaxID=2729096 RepID=A0A7W4K3U3_9PROT|nr:hypothetical protein [Gluconacetobacter dulcium]MBB2199891.1 hypothetical protein [Gluconacetobacter dulcium]